MKLSEAMMLPTDIPFYAGEYLSDGRGCFLGQAMNVVTGREDARCWEIEEVWPWLEQEFIVPLEIAESDDLKNYPIGLKSYPIGATTSGTAIISRYAFMFEMGAITREKAADWVRANEPQENLVEVEDEVRAACAVG
jgi:hypothetical protein